MQTQHTQLIYLTHYSFTKTHCSVINWRDGKLNFHCQTDGAFKALKLSRLLQVPLILRNPIHFPHFLFCSVFLCLMKRKWVKTAISSHQQSACKWPKGNISVRITGTLRGKSNMCRSVRRRLQALIPLVSASSSVHGGWRRDLFEPRLPPHPNPSISASFRGQIKQCSNLASPPSRGRKLTFPLFSHRPIM